MIQIFAVCDECGKTESPRELSVSDIHAAYTTPLAMYPLVEKHLADGGLCSRCYDRQHEQPCGLAAPTAAVRALENQDVWIYRLRWRSAARLYVPRTSGTLCWVGSDITYAASVEDILATDWVVEVKEENNGED